MLLAELALLLFIRLCEAASSEVLSCLRLERSHIESPHMREVHVEEERPAYLHCRVPRNTNHMVAWSRASDSALLTAGFDTFTTDPRFQISKRTEEDYVLIIRQSHPRDSGCYLCEINTEPVSTIVPVYLNVTRKELGYSTIAHKKPGRLLANMQGNEVVLNCTFAVDNQVDEQEVHWQKDNKVIDFNESQKYVLKVKRDAGLIVQEMVIREASNADDGEYSCIRGKQKASQIVHVNFKAEAQKFSSSLTSMLPFSIICLRLYL